jgi:biotin transporter BioY
MTVRRKPSSTFTAALIPTVAVVFLGALYMAAMFGISSDNWMAFAYWLIPVGVIAYVISLAVLFLLRRLVKTD